MQKGWSRKEAANIPVITFFMAKVNFANLLEV